MYWFFWYSTRNSINTCWLCYTYCRCCFTNGLVNEFTIYSSRFFFWEKISFANLIFSLKRLVLLVIMPLFFVHQWEKKLKIMKKLKKLFGILGQGKWNSIFKSCRRVQTLSLRQLTALGRRESAEPSSGYATWTDDWESA